MASTRTFIASLFIIFLFLASSSSSSAKKSPKHYKPCKKLVFFFSETLFNGTNGDTATSAIVAAPYGANLTSLADHFYFGDVVVFDDPITLDKNPNSKPVGRAQGMYLYDTKNTFTAWHSFSFVFNSDELRGTVQFMGVNQLLNKTRELSVVGGTGDFFMHRGTATFTTVAVEWRTYYQLRVEIKFYECW